MVVDVGRVVERLDGVSRARGNTAARTGRAHGAVVRARNRCREAVKAQLLTQRAIVHAPPCSARRTGLPHTRADAACQLARSEDAQDARLASALQDLLARAHTDALDELLHRLAIGHYAARRGAADCARAREGGVRREGVWFHRRAVGVHWARCREHRRAICPCRRHGKGVRTDAVQCHRRGSMQWCVHDRPRGAEASWGCTSSRLRDSFFRERMQRGTPRESNEARCSR